MIKTTEPPPNSDELNPEIKKAVDAICAGGTLSELRGLGENDMEAIYGLGFNLYTHARYEEAEKIFAFLCIYNHLEKRFWKGLAASRQMWGRHLAAADAYGYMAICDLDDPEPHFQAARCLIAANEKKRAVSALDAAIEIAEKTNTPSYKTLAEQAAQLKKIIVGNKPRRKAGKK